jgi:hypothetical protein
LVAEFPTVWAAPEGAPSKKGISADTFVSLNALNGRLLSSVFRRVSLAMHLNPVEKCLIARESVRRLVEYFYLD